MILDPSLVTHPSMSQALETCLWTDGFRAWAGSENDKVRRGKDKAIDTLWQVEQEVEKRGMQRQIPNM